MDGGTLRERAGKLPTEPGVYQFQAGDRVLYVGKAVDLRSRVRSYTDPRSDRIAQMVARAESLEVAVTDTETQALLLEANLIKRHQPRYNVRLKDDKSYPLVQFTDHEIPRIESTRDPNDAATVFGPFTDKGRIETVIKAIRSVYGLRGCSEHKYQGRDRPCLDYEMGLCTAPCTGEIDAESYREDVEAAIRFFEGETGVLADPLRREMEAAAQEQAFERAANLRDQLDTVETIHDDSERAVASGDAAEAGGDETVADVLGVAVDGDHATVARLRSERGQLVDRSRHSLDAPDEADGGDRVAALLSAFLPQYYAERQLPDAILLSERPDDDDVIEWLEREGVAVRVPGAGREATLVELALKNARQGPVDGDPLAALGEALGIDRPGRIEGFDVSHSQGKAVVGSNVCFVDGSAETGDYRRKQLTDRNDDYANMRELIEWRADRALEGRDDRPDPDLLLVDGGEGQLGAAMDALDKTGWDVPVVALAKDEELVITPDRVFDWPSDADHLHVCQRVRDEAHRFAVQYHQQLRDDVSTALDGIPGVGPETRKRLLRRFGSVDNVRDASQTDLQAVDGVGEKTAATIAERL
ncbi:excinuclease ABC subunit C [Halonotius aquaticus]|uniref:UvrABC system protein C n=1 Tax=Halonotius aquaticus TaxID=2216978 RepID=A0A3A6PZU6_9EURY|nr:excinuclease ABC subunit C [Halonotius aquaticus]RJX42393.1 excinuclease ABC subunit C [Halonotius aquaticus]